MKLAESSRRKLEAFFRQTLCDEKFQLPLIYFYSGKFSTLLTFVLKIHGITIGRNIFVAPKFLSQTTDNRLKINVELAAHEIAHVLQFKREGFVKFFFIYLKSYGRNLRAKKNFGALSRHEAYLEIPFEIQARELAAKFASWNKETENVKRKMEN